MASQGVAATSRLAQMQMKFKQKQMQEREQRRIEMTGERSVTEEILVPVKNVGNGKVRQMFDERRRGAGIDRSHPLRPIVSTTKSVNATVTNTTPNNRVPAARRQVPAVGRRNVGRTETYDQSLSSSRNSLDAANGNVSKVHRTSFDQTDNLDSDAFPKAFSSLSLREYEVPSNEMGDHNGGSAKSGMSRVMSSNSIKLKPVLTKKSPSVTSSRSTAPSLASASKARTTRATATTIAARKPPASTLKTTQKSSVSKMSASKMGIKPPPRVVTPPPGMASCKICNRNFLEDRLAKHEQVCQKMASSRRRIFDASKHRVKGTEAEKYLKKPVRSTISQKTPTAYSSAASGMTLPANSGLKKNNWRKKHEEFIAAIRAAKQVQAHLARGGKLSDLPPPPPSENPDYVQCPHCMRRFNEAAAERHIPKCATMLHNKPKPGNAKKR